MEYQPFAPDLSQIRVIRRNGEAVPFNSDKISIAITKAFLAVGGDDTALSQRVRTLVSTLTHAIVIALTRRIPIEGAIHIEAIQDQVELALMRIGEHDVAKAYVLYREKRSTERSAQKQPQEPGLYVTDGSTRQLLDRSTLMSTVTAACTDLEDVAAATVVDHALKNLYDGMPIKEVSLALTLAARTMIETEPNYRFVAARLQLQALQQEVLGSEFNSITDYFSHFITLGIKAELLNNRLAEFNLAILAAALKPERDLQLGYLGLQTLYDRYFLHKDGHRIEMPQVFFMRVAMGLSLNETHREKCAIEFYNVLSCFDFMSSTPTLFNSGTPHPQLSSCYLTTVDDDLDSIFLAIRENALLQKYAGGLGNDWTPVRALGSYIKGTNGKSQGVIPFLKVVNDTAVAVNQGGKRKGAVCVYLETWHLDIEEFLELRKNTGDERRRCHDLNTAHWIPDLFMQRMMRNEVWTLFSPSEVPDLHERYGRDFESAYLSYEQQALSGILRQYKQISAVQLWRKMLTMLFETGMPWICFKDACNLRSPQRHVGVIHSSNLCTEITLNTSKTETAVCNLGSINLAAHLKNGELDLNHLQRTIKTAMRMLDNVIDINYYASTKAQQANLCHRPVGLGIMGFADCLAALHWSYASEEALHFADHSMEAVCYFAYLASSELAEERGFYPSFNGSDWSNGIVPPDTVGRLAEERGIAINVTMNSRFDWEALRQHIRTYGMRNSNCIAIAPTATISNIVGVSASIEPIYQNLYVKSNLSGEFTMVNNALVDELKKLGLWDEVMVADLKFFDGSLSKIDRIPTILKERYATAFEIDPQWLIKAAALRQKWIDQAQSLNLYLAHPSGRKLDELYQLAWQCGLKTTYYLRTLSATHAEKSVDVHHNESVANLCLIDNPDCESCQ